MRWMSRAVVVAAVLTPTLASAALSQRRASAETGAFARRASMPVPKQQPTPSMTGPEWSAFGGFASGDGAYDLGFALGGSGRWRRSDWPVAVRGDAYFAHHGGDIGTPLGGYDVSINIFGVMANAEYVFPTEGNLKPYAFGGLGIFYSNIDLDYDGIFEDSSYDSSTDLGFGVGGGLRLTQRFGVEVRFMDIGGFSTIPLLAVLHF